MNAVLDTIENRRSIRAYKTTPVPRDLLEKILRAGSQAPFFNPTWGLERSGRFVVAHTAESRQKLLQAALGFYNNWKETRPDDHPIKRARAQMGVLDAEDPVYYSAPAVVFVIGGTGNTSCHLACQNIMLAAKSLGLGSCWVGFGAQVTDDPEIVELLDLKEEESIVGCLVLGYPDEDPPPPPREEEPLVKWI